MSSPIINNLAAKLRAAEQLAEAVEASQHMETVYELWRNDDDEEFEEAALADGFEDVHIFIGHEYLEFLRDRAIAMQFASLESWRLANA